MGTFYYNFKEFHNHANIHKLLALLCHSQCECAESGLAVAQLPEEVHYLSDRQAGALQE